MGRAVLLTQRRVRWREWNQFSHPLPVLTRTRILRKTRQERYDASATTMATYQPTRPHCLAHQRLLASYNPSSPSQHFFGVADARSVTSSESFTLFLSSFLRERGQDDGVDVRMHERGGTHTAWNHSNPRTAFHRRQPGLRQLPLQFYSSTRLLLSER